MAKKVAKPALKPAPKPTPRPLPRPRPAQLDLVRNPNFDAAMAQQNFLNSLAELRAKADAERGTPTPPSGPLGGPVGSARSKRDPSKEIILNFAGGNFGVANDSAANEIAKKYNLEIVRKPEEGSNVPNYTFKSNGNVNDIISQIKNEPGIGYAEQNFVIPAPYVRGESQPTQRPPQGSQVGGGNQDIIDFRKRIYDDLMARQGQPFSPDGGIGGAQNFDIDYIEGGQRNAPMTPTPSQIAQFRNAQQGAVPMDQNTGKIGRQFDQIAEGMMPQNPQGQQQMQSYQNFLNQGMNNMASVNQGAAANFANTQPGMPTTGSAQQPNATPAMPVAGMGARKLMPTPRKFSTVSSQPARFV